MKAIEKPFEEELPPLLIYLEDIEEVCEILRESGRTVSITTEDYTFENATELEHLPDVRIHKLDINGDNKAPSLDVIYISLSTGWATVRTFQHNVTSYGLAAKIHKRLSNCRRPLVSRLTSFLLFGMGILSFGVLILPRPWNLFSFAAAIWVFLLAWWYRFNKYVTVIPRYRKDRVSFWKRNSDAILLSIVTGIIGTGFGIAGTLVTQRLQNSRNSVAPTTQSNISSPTTR
jgi:hypothetical protein